MRALGNHCAVCLCHNLAGLDLLVPQGLHTGVGYTTALSGQVPAVDRALHHPATVLLSQQLQSEQP